MTITRDVVLDLLPLYLANEASEDSKQLIENFLNADPEFARWVENNKTTLLPETVTSPAAHLEKETYMNFTRLQRKKSLLMAFAIFFTAMPFAFLFDGDKGLVWWMLKDNPSQAFSFLFLAVCTWIGYLWVARDQTGQ